MIFPSIGGMFLWHYPHGRPHWALPSKFGLSGARTFLRLFWGVRNRLRLLSPIFDGITKSVGFDVKPNLRRLGFVVSNGGVSWVSFLNPTYKLQTIASRFIGRLGGLAN